MIIGDRVRIKRHGNRYREGEVGSISASSESYPEGYPHGYFLVEFSDGVSAEYQGSSLDPVPPLEQLARALDE